MSGDPRYWSWFYFGNKGVWAWALPLFGIAMGGPVGVVIQQATGWGGAVVVSAVIGAVAGASGTRHVLRDEREFRRGTDGEAEQDRSPQRPSSV